MNTDENFKKFMTDPKIVKLLKDNQSNLRTLEYTYDNIQNLMNTDPNFKNIITNPELERELENNPSMREQLKKIYYKKLHELHRAEFRKRKQELERAYDRAEERAG